MSSALLGMGSNINPRENLLFAAAALRQAFMGARFSPVYQSKAIGMQGDDFFNACCIMQGAFSFEALERWCKQHEDSCQRNRALGSWKPRTIDLDILMFNNQVKDDELFRFAHAYVPAESLIELEPAVIDRTLLTHVDLIL